MKRKSSRALLIACLVLLLSTCSFEKDYRYLAEKKSHSGSSSVFDSRHHSEESDSRKGQQNNSGHKSDKVQPPAKAKPFPQGQPAEKGHSAPEKAQPQTPSRHERDGALQGYTGWLELPFDQKRAGDYLYITHLCPDLKAGGHAARNYTVCYSVKAGCAIWVAAPMHRCYVEKRVERTNDWQFDPKVSLRQQPDLRSAYRKKYSRGHMVASGDRISTAGSNAQTFFFTNMTPQIQNGFNAGMWSYFERKVQELAMKTPDTLYVVTGAHFADYRTSTTDRGGRYVAVPTHFYKVLIRSKSGRTGRSLRDLRPEEMECAAWLLEHRPYKGEKNLRKYIMSVEQLERITGQEFFTHLPNAPKQRLDVSFWKF